MDSAAVLNSAVKLARQRGVACLRDGVFWPSVRDDVADVGLHQFADLRIRVGPGR